MLCKHGPNQDFYEKKIVGTDNAKVPTEWDMAPRVSFHANTYSVSLFGLLAVLSHCLEKFLKMENEKFCLKEVKKKQTKKPVELLVFKPAHVCLCFVLPNSFPITPALCSVPLS